MYRNEIIAFAKGIFANFRQWIGQIDRGQAGTFEKCLTANASDGIWEFLDNKEVCDFVKYYYLNGNAKNAADTAAEDLENADSALSTAEETDKAAKKEKEQHEAGRAS